MPNATVIKLSDVLNQANKGHLPLTDDEILLSCVCGPAVSAGKCKVVSGVETTYRCHKCNRVLVIIGAPNPDGQPWPGRGYRLRDFSVRNAVDIRYRGLVLQRSPNALATERPKDA